MKKILLGVFLLISALSVAARVVKDTEVDKEYNVELKDDIVYEKGEKNFILV